MQEPKTVCDSLGLGNSELRIENYELRLFPNPNDGNFTLRFNSTLGKKGSLYVHNIHGQLMYKQSISEWTNECDLHLKDKLTAGAYIVSLYCGDKVARVKVLVK